MKSCASSTVGSGPQPAAMRLDYGTANGQSHAAALRLGREKRRKDLVSTATWQSRTGVADRELELAVLQLRFHCKLSACVIHGFDGVKHQVHEHLLQLHPVSRDFWEVGGKFRAHGNGESSGLTVQQRKHFEDNSVHIDQLTF